MSRHAQVPEGVLDLAPTQIKVYVAVSILRDYRTDLSDATTHQIAETARVDHRACRRALQALEAIGWLTTVTAHTSRRAAVRKVEMELREGAVVTPLRGRPDPLQRGSSYPPPHRYPEKDARASGAEPPAPAYPQENPMPDDAAQDGLFDAQPDPGAAHRKAVRQRPKSGAAAVVAAYAEAYQDHHGRPAFATSRDKIGRESRSKLAHGVATEQELVEAADRLGRTEYENLDLEVKKLRQERDARNKSQGTVVKDWNADGYRPMGEEEAAQAVEDARTELRERLARTMQGRTA